MSLCSCTLRALSRPRVPKSKTLVPFLYQTATIQQWHPIARRNASSRSNRDDHIPFEGEALPLRIEEVESDRKTTITGSERAAFENLYKKFNTEGKAQDDSTAENETDQVADEYYEEDDDKDSSAESLDKLFDTVLSGKYSNGPARFRKQEDLSTLAADVLRPEREKAKQAAKERKERAHKAVADEKERIKKLFHDANTDRELWESLERDVFDPVRRLDLDGLGAQKKKGVATSREIDPAHRFPTSPVDKPWVPQRKTADSRTIFSTFPHHLVEAVTTLHKTFPASPLALSILPTLKSLGRSSYALGATTAFYGALIRIVWKQHASYDYVDELLRDMDNGGIECDARILNLLDEILAENEFAKVGRLGRPTRIVFSLEQYEEGAKKLQAWRDTVAQRLGVWADTKRKRVMIRKVDPKEPEKRNFVPGPRDELTKFQETDKAIVPQLPALETTEAVVSPVDEKGEVEEAKESEEFVLASGLEEATGKLEILEQTSEESSEKPSEESSREPSDGLPK